MDDIGGKTFMLVLTGRLSTLSWSEMESSILWILDYEGIMSAEGPAMRCRSDVDVSVIRMISYEILNALPQSLADDGTTSAEGPAMKWRSEIVALLFALPGWSLNFLPIGDLQRWYYVIRISIKFLPNGERWRWCYVIGKTDEAPPMMIRRLSGNDRVLVQYKAFQYIL